MPLIFIFLCSLNFIYAQSIYNEYLPEHLDSLKFYLKRINRNHLEKISGEYASKIKKFYKNRDEKIFKTIEDSSYIFNPKINEKLDVILHHIYRSNPDINHQDFGFFIKNSIVPNAASYGDGMFEIHLGLLNKLNSDAELAFIICHEMAHKELDHSLKNIRKGISLLKSNETKKKVKEIKKKRFGKTRAALSIVDELNIDMLDYSREAEAEADSLGFLFYSRTKYLKSYALSALEHLKEVDEMILNHDVQLDSVFNFNTYPFRSHWLKKTTSLFDVSEKINEFSLKSDTLKTHPEIDFRVKKLIGDFNIKRGVESKKVESPLFTKLKQITHLQSIQFTLDFKLLDLVIYQLIEKYNNGVITEGYYYTKMAETWKCIYQIKKSHELGKYVPQANDFSDEKQLNAIRLLLHNLELGEVKKIGLEFCKSRGNDNYSEAFKEVYEFFKLLNN